MTEPCPFCAIVNDGAPVDLVAHWPNVWAITPLNPVTPGHVLFIPTVHVEDFTTDPAISSSVMFRAAQWAQGRGACNLLTSLGADASQSVFHFHLHYVPRRPGDGLELPWPQHTDGRGGLTELTSANGATDRGTLSAPVAPADPTAAQTRSASVPPLPQCEAVHPDHGRCTLAAGHPVGPWFPGAHGHIFENAANPGPRTGSSAAGSVPPG